MPMCKLPQLRLVTYRGQSRMIVAIDVPAGLVELAPRPNTLDPSSAGEVGRPGLQYLGMRPVPGDVVSVADCVPRPDLTPDWPWDIA